MGVWAQWVVACRCHSVRVVWVSRWGTRRLTRRFCVATEILPNLEAYVDYQVSVLVRARAGLAAESRRVHTCLWTRSRTAGWLRAHVHSSRYFPLCADPELGV